MSKINEIQSKLLEIEAGQFQKLCEAYYTIRGFKVHSYGSKIGTNKTRKGKPDSYIMDEDKYIFIECSTDQTLRFKKLKKDLEECFDVKKTKIEPYRITEVKLCFTFILAPNEVNILSEITREHKCKLELLDISTLSNELCHFYPHLAKEFLGVSYDTNQILKPKQFKVEYGKNKMTVGFDNEFLFRANELNLCLGYLKNYDLLIIKGEAGSGKTRFALQLQKEFVKLNKDYNDYVIMNNGVNNIYEDSKTFFKKGNKYIIIIDDANRGIPNLRVALALLNEENIEVKILLTVREYAYKQINNILKEYSKKIEVEIKNFGQKELEKILDTFKLIWEAKVKIYQVTNGNPRLAIMCAKYVLETHNLFSLNNVTEIFDSYYQLVLNEFSGKKDIVYLKVLGIIAYLRVIDKNNEELFEKINNVFNIDKTLFWDTVFELHNKEVLDSYENLYVKFSDQVFQNYIFYKVFFDSDILDYGLLLLNFSSDFRYSNLITDSLNPVLNNFGVDKIIDKLKRHFNLWVVTYKENSGVLLKILKQFWFVDELFTLVLIENYIKHLPKGNIRRLRDNLNINEAEERKRSNITDNYLEILEQFNQSRDFFRKALDLIFLYLDKKPDLYWKILKYIKTDLIYNRFSYSERYFFQYTLFDYLIEKTESKNNRFLFNHIIFEISNTFLQTSIRSGMSTDRNTFTFINIKLILTTEIKQLREKTFNYIFSNYALNKESVIIFLSKYIHSYEDDLQKDIYIFDTQFIIPFIEKKLNLKLFKDCKIVNEYIEFLEKRVTLNKYSYLKSKFTNETFVIYRLLKWDDKKLFKMRSEKYYEYLKEKYKIKFNEYNINDYNKLFNCFNEIINNCKDHEEYNIKNSIQIILLNTLEKNSKYFLEIIKIIITQGNKIKITPHTLFSEIYKRGKIFTKIFFDIIKKGKYEYKNYWLIEFIEYLPEDLTNIYYLKEFYNLLKNNQLIHICLTNYTFLFYYKRYDSNVFFNTLRILISRTKAKRFQVDFTYLLFRLEDNDDIIKELKNDINLIKRIYLYQLSIRPMDYSKKVFKFIVEKDENFIIEYLKFKFKGKDFISAHDEFSDFTALWEMDNYEKTINKAIEYCRKNIKYGIINSFKNVFFKNIPYEGKVELFIKKYIKKNIKRFDKINYMFSIITNNYPDKRLEIIKYLFVDVDYKYEEFEKLYLESSSWSSSGNAIPVYEGFIKYWEQVMELMKEINKHEHTIYISNKIKKWKDMIRKELKDNFVEEY